MSNVFITGATGYIGKRLIKALQKDGNYSIQALLRKGSKTKIPAGCEVLVGDALDRGSDKQLIRPGSTFIHLVGVAHPSPAKKDQFKKVDLVSMQEANCPATSAGVHHFIYLSVSQYPSGIMKDYQAVRAQGEAMLKNSGLRCSFIRPWYVLGPGHWWPLVILPFYTLFSIFPAHREMIRQQGLVTIDQMIETLLFAIKNPPTTETAIYNVPDIKNILSININLGPVL